MLGLKIQIFGVMVFTLGVVVGMNGNLAITIAGLIIIFIGIFV